MKGVAVKLTDYLICVLIGLMLVNTGVLLVSLHKDRTLLPLANAAESDHQVWEAAPGTILTTSGLPIDGNATAKLALIEFSDFQCPYCARYATTVLPELRKDFVSSGKMQYVFVNLPLPGHQQAKSLAKAAACAGKQGRFWSVHDALFTQQANGSQNILETVRQQGVNRDQFAECIAASDTDQQIERDLDTTARFQLRATPAFAIGSRNPDGSILIQKFFAGARPLEFFEQTINSALAAAS